MTDVCLISRAAHEQSSIPVLLPGSFPTAVSQLSRSNLGRSFAEDPGSAKVSRYAIQMRFVFFAIIGFFANCVNVDNICPHKPITQGVFGEILDASGSL